MADDSKPIDKVALNKMLVMLVDNQTAFANKIKELSKLYVVQSDVIAQLSKSNRSLQKKVAELQSKKDLVKPPTVTKIYN